MYPQTSTLASIHILNMMIVLPEVRWLRPSEISLVWIVLGYRFIKRPVVTRPSCHHRFTSHWSQLCYRHDATGSAGDETEDAEHDAAHSALKAKQSGFCCSTSASNCSCKLPWHVQRSKLHRALGLWVLVLSVALKWRLIKVLFTKSPSSDEILRTTNNASRLSASAVKPLHWNCTVNTVRGRRIGVGGSCLDPRTSHLGPYAWWANKFKGK